MNFKFPLIDLKFADVFKIMTVIFKINEQVLKLFLMLSSVTYAINTYVQPLIDSGKIKLSIPDVPSSPKQKYYS